SRATGRRCLEQGCSRFSCVSDEAELTARRMIILAVVISSVACGTSATVTAPTDVVGVGAKPRIGHVQVTGRVIDFTTNQGVADVIVGFQMFGESGFRT